VNGSLTIGALSTVVANLPDASLPELGGQYGHELKNIAIDRNGLLYVSIGSTCNVCTSDTQSNPVRASVYRYNADGSGGRLYARGLRNAEGLAMVPGRNALWVVVNNRDNVPYPFNDGSGNYGRVFSGYVDDNPPELFTKVKDGGNYGWPFCNSNPNTAGGFDDMPFNLDYDTNLNGTVNCSAMSRPTKGIPAHSAPLGLTFMQGTLFPPKFRKGAMVALHGSWNRTMFQGGKVAYFPWDAATQRPGPQYDFVSGWLNSNNYWGRPVDTAVDPTGALLISDDLSGTVYRLWKSGVIP
jgi:glucose/arabinose dehydrogenase